MKQMFLIDYENVGLLGLVGISNLKAGDEIVIFYSGDISAVMEILSAYEDKGVKISYECLSSVGKNALDFMISVRVGYECRVRSKKEIHIVSKDNGYKSALVYAMKLNKNVTVDTYVNIANVKIEPAKDDKQAIQNARKERYMELLSGTGVQEKYYVPLVGALLSSETVEEAETKIRNVLGKRNGCYIDAVLKCYNFDNQEVSDSESQ